MTGLLICIGISAIITLVHAGRGRLTAVPTLLRMIPLTLALDLLLSYAGLGPKFTPQGTTIHDVTLVVGLLTLLNLNTCLWVRR